MAEPGSLIAAPLKFRPRRNHRKSRFGCFECKRRKIKARGHHNKLAGFGSGADNFQCDERKPACTHCGLTLHVCRYPPCPPASLAESKRYLSLPSPPSSAFSSSPKALCGSDEEARDPVNPTRVGGLSSFNLSFDGPTHADANLYHHYLEHTARKMARYRSNRSMWLLGIPTQALQSPAVFQSVLALSSVCKCHDLVSQETKPNPSDVNELLMIGYEHYSASNGHMRDLLGQPSGSGKECLLTASLLLVPFAAASQQISRWLSQHTHDPFSSRLLRTTPRDLIVLMRGIRVTLAESGSEDKLRPDERAGRWPFSPSIAVEQSPARGHVMAPIIATTVEKALLRVAHRLHEVQRRHAGSHYVSGLMTACAAAVEILATIAKSTFEELSADDTSTLSVGATTLSRDPTSVPHVTTWLRLCANEGPSCRDGLTRPFLRFLVQVPKEYIDELLPLLDRRLDSPISGFLEDAEVLNKEQALVLDIYAHWSVLMLLVEEESWWIGNLPTVTLDGLLNRYGDDFVDRFWPVRDGEKGGWWPAAMLRISKEFKGWQ